MSENPRRGRQARNFTTNVPKILDLKSSYEQIFFRKLTLGAPGSYQDGIYGGFVNSRKPLGHFAIYRTADISLLSRLLAVLKNDKNNFLTGKLFFAG